MLKALHIADLSGIGGVEQKLRFYLRDSARRARIEHHLLVCGSALHAGLRADVTAAAASVSVGKCRWGLKLPRWPRFLRRLNFHDCLRRIDHDVVMLWNRFGDDELITAVRSVSQAPVVHCECGGAWYGDSDARARVYARNVSAVVCASQACRRVLELRWDWNGRVAAVVNGLRPDCLPEAVRPRRLAKGARVKLGAAARMMPIKGLCLAVHALKHLRDAGCDAELHVAGGGSARGQRRFRGLVANLDLSRYVTLHGIVHDMPAFYRGIDVFLCPSLREPFGSVCLEAAAWGCVTVASRVDGLVEAVRDGVTGHCITPDIPLEHYPALGGSFDRLPSFVYDPTADAIVPPKLVAPQALAQTVAALAESPDTYERMSAAAINRVRTDFPFERYVTALDGALIDAAEQE
jgi:glycosyltransferase involved in cell wall biosynthesis